MPTYSYLCTECDNAFDVQQSFTDASLTVCPSCSGVLRKVFSPVGVSFTGSGFYRNDSRATPSQDKQKGGSESSDKSFEKAPEKSSDKSSAKSSSPDAKPSASTKDSTTRAPAKSRSEKSPNKKPSA